MSKSYYIIPAGADPADLGAWTIRDDLTEAAAEDLRAAGYIVIEM